MSIELSCLWPYSSALSGASLVASTRHMSFVTRYADLHGIPAPLVSCWAV